MVQEDYAGKAHAVKTNWRDISPNSPPSLETQAIFGALTASAVHSSPTPQAPDGHHVQVERLSESEYQTLYFTRELTQEEKNLINALFDMLRRHYSP